MSDRYHCLTVVLEKEFRDDDAEKIIDAIRMIRGVLEVSPHVADPETYSAQERARRDLTTKLFKILQE